LLAQFLFHRIELSNLSHKPRREFGLSQRFVKTSTRMCLACSYSTGTLVLVPALRVVPLLP
jgi:hypothetical protein